MSEDRHFSFKILYGPIQLFTEKRKMKKMNTIRNRITAILIVILLSISIGSSIIQVPTISAHDPSWNIPTYAYVQGAPDPLGVGQTSTIYMWLDISYDNAALYNDYRFHDYKLTITAPDGTITSQTFATVSDPTSNQGYKFIPTQVGIYNLNFTFPGQIITTSNDDPASDYIGDTYLPSSASATLTVQNEPVSSRSTTPLPSEYWTRPIYGENPNWWTISSNWRGIAGSGRLGYGSDFPGDAVGPQTSHVMWTKQLQSGGVVGGNDFVIQGDTYFQGSAYADRLLNPIILDGMLFYTEPLSFAGVPSYFVPQSYGPTDCVNLRTGQLIWSRNDVPELSFGYIYDVQTPNQHGVYQPILFSASGSDWRAFDAYTGEPLFNVTNIPSGRSAMGPNGEYLIYVLANDGTPTNPQYYLGQWNSSRLWDDTYIAGMIPTIAPPITNGTDPSLYDWRISMPSLNTATTDPALLVAFNNNMLICLTGSLPLGFAASLPAMFGGPTVFPQLPYTYSAVNLNATKGAIGSILWTQTVQPYPGNLTVSFIGADPTAKSGTGVFFEYHLETMQWVGYSMATGEKLWGPVGDETDLSYYNNDHMSTGQSAQCAYGKLYTTGYGGLLYCYDLTNGNLLWTYGNGGEGNSTSSGEYSTGVYPALIYAIGSGIVYINTAEHTVETPIYKGALIRAINATTGQEVWTISGIVGESSRSAIADGYSIFCNGYDNRVYSVGRGPSTTTVSAPSLAAASSQSVVISGTVMDISSGTKQDEQTARFPNGVPVASDASMKEWMGYVYQQQSMSHNFTGVVVAINVVDSNGNYRTIGTADTDANGYYSLQWTPDISGKYNVFATFAGTNGYWPSQAETSFAVDPAAVTPAPTAVPGQSMADIYLLPGIIGIIVAIVVVGLVLALLVTKKRP